MKRSSGPADGHEDQHEADLTQVHLDRADMQVHSGRAHLVAMGDLSR